MLERRGLLVKGYYVFPRYPFLSAPPHPTLPWFAAPQPLMNIAWLDVGKSVIKPKSGVNKNITKIKEFNLKNLYVIISVFRFATYLCTHTEATMIRVGSAIHQYLEIIIPRHNLYAEEYIVFVFPFVCSFVRTLVRSWKLESKFLHQSLSDHII